MAEQKAQSQQHKLRPGLLLDEQLEKSSRNEINAGIVHLAKIIVVAHGRYEVIARGGASTKNVDPRDKCCDGEANVLAIRITSRPPMFVPVLPRARWPCPSVRLLQ